MSNQETLLLLTHFYPPDPAAVGQYMAEAATDLASRGYRVVVLTSARGFEDPAARYPRRETRDGVEIHRLPLASFGKGSLRLRLLGALSFVAQAALRGLLTRHLAGILVSTSPPMAPAAAIVISKLRRVPYTFWVMDINPDQAIALGKIHPDALSTRLQEHLMRSTLRHAARVVPLDRFMRERLEQKVGKEVLDPKTSVIPLWPLGDLEPVPHEENPFRHEHDLDGKFVVMYSGNLGVNAPLDTLLPAMLHFKAHPEIVFVFIGGGTARPRLEAFVEEHGLENVRLLPYQPLDRLKYSLSAGDVHIVSMAEELVGICHSSKIYGVMGTAKPVLDLGPRSSHVTDLLSGAQSQGLQFGQHLHRSDSRKLAESFLHFASLSTQEIEILGQNSQAAATSVSAKPPTAVFAEKTQEMLTPEPPRAQRQTARREFKRFKEEAPD